jgi:class 3 adenylate cyclase
VTDYFDTENGNAMLVYDSKTEEILYSTSGRERFIPEELRSATADRVEGEVSLQDRFGYFVRYTDPPITFFVYTMDRTLFLFRNQLLYLLTGVVALFSLLLFFAVKGGLKRWDQFLDHTGASFADVIQGKRNLPDRIDDAYAETGEFGEFPRWYNTMLDRVASVFKQFEERLRSLFKQRDSLKKMIYLYKKYIPDEALVRINERDVDDVVSRKQDVTSMHIELMNFLEPLGELYPQVITDELNELHVFIKDEVIKGNGIINFTRGHHINVVFGVPNADERSFVQACAGARKLYDWVGERNRSERNMSGTRWAVHFGIDHGPAVTGIVGFNYLVVGEVIDRSSRMLEFAQRFNVPLVTDYVEKLEQGGGLSYRKLDIVPAGQSSTYPIYEIFLKKTETLDQAIRLFNHGVEMFYDERYEMAVLEFKKADSLLENDNPSKVFLSRCERAIKGKEERSFTS